MVTGVGALWSHASARVQPKKLSIIALSLSKKHFHINYSHPDLPCTTRARLDQRRDENAEHSQQHRDALR
jgi:hypothetical protein